VRESFGRERGKIVSRKAHSGRSSRPPRIVVRMAGGNIGESYETYLKDGLPSMRV